MSKRKKIAFIVLSVCALFTVSLIIINIIPIPRSYNMRWVLTHKISNIARKHSSVLSHSKFIDKDNMNWLIQDSNYNRKHLSNLGENDEVIYIKFYKSVLKSPEPDELYTIFESFLFIKEQTLSYNIVAIASGNLGGVWHVTITKEDFERLYAFLDANARAGKRSEIAKQLAEMWAYENFYNRRRLVLNEQNEFRNQLATTHEC